MIDIEHMTPIEIQRAGLEVLARELGPCGLIRFLQQFERGAGDYTSERHQWLDSMDMEGVFGEIARLRADRAKGKS